MNKHHSAGWTHPISRNPEIAENQLAARRMVQARGLAPHTRHVLADVLGDRLERFGYFDLHGR